MCLNPIEACQIFKKALDKYPHGVYNVYIPYGGIILFSGANMEHKEMKECCCKKTERAEEERTKLIHRLNRIEGQIRGIRAMVEKDAYCPDILMQSAAVNAAVNAFNKDLIAGHIHHCVVRDVREGNEEVIDELVATLQKLMK